MLYFNSIKVRLEPYPLPLMQRYDFLFQFHKGAIRTPWVLMQSSLVIPHFNSIKVRLELDKTAKGNGIATISIP